MNTPKPIDRQDSSPGRLPAIMRTVVYLAGQNPAAMPLSPFRCCYLLAILLLSGCAAGPQAPAPDPQVYRADWDTWRQERQEELLAPEGWLALVGLHWLEAGEQQYGSDSTHRIVFPPAAPALIGTLRLHEDSVFLRRQDSTSWQLIYAPEQEAVTLEDGPFRYTIIERGGRYGVRLYDTSVPSRIRMAPIDTFPLDPAWRLPARFEAFAAPETLLVRNVLDMNIPQVVEGKVTFEKDGQPYSLHVLDGGPEHYFLIFADPTNGETTYGGGRYLYVDRPTAAGELTVDFNYAYNPPCYFTAFATCLLPPAENRLDLAITAGEKADSEH